MGVRVCVKGEVPLDGANAGQHTDVSIGASDCDNEQVLMPNEREVVSIYMLNGWHVASVLGSDDL